MGYEVNHKFLGENFLKRVKSAFDPSPEPPEPPEPEIEMEEVEEEEREVPENPADYKQDPNCPEGKWKPSGAAECVDDPVYIELMERMSAELRDLEEQERKAAEKVKMEEAREQLRIEQEAQRQQMDEARRQQRIAEEQQVQMLVVYGIVGFGILIAITLVVKLVF